jgi:hypothetical protein
MEPDFLEGLASLALVVAKVAVLVVLARGLR